MKPRLLTIKGKTMSIHAWSRQPGAVCSSTISWRLKFMGYTPEMAVFGANLRPVGEGAHARIVKVKRRPIPPAQKFDVGQLPRWGSVQSVTFNRAA